MCALVALGLYIVLPNLCDTLLVFEDKQAEELLQFLQWNNPPLDFTIPCCR